MQDADNPKLSVADLKIATQRAPTEDELNALLFAWKVVKHVKSNAVVYARDGQTVGIGAGQMSRVDAARFGAMKAVLSAQGLRRRLRRVLSLPRRTRSRSANRSHRRHPARRLREGSGRDRRRRSPGPRHGLHRHPPLPPLKTRAVANEARVVANETRVVATEAGVVTAPCRKRQTESAHPKTGRRPDSPHSK